MCSTPEIFSKKLKFIEKYNSTRTIDSALSSSFDAALQRNKLYGLDTSTWRRKQIKAFCSDEILKISQKYVNSITVEEFEHDILDLRSSMNEEYKEYFDNDGFKISHSQKSLSVFLKIQWVNGKIATPPLCPVDRTILVAAGQQQPDAWTNVNTLPEYRRHIRFLKQGSRNHACSSLACWELCNF